MEWNMIIFENVHDKFESIKNLRAELSERYRDLDMPVEYKAYKKDMPGDQRHYYFPPTISEMAKDILCKYKVELIPALESLDGLTPVVF